MAILFDKQGGVGLMFWDSRWGNDIKAGVRYTISMDFNNGAMAGYTGSFTGGRGDYGTYVFIDNLKWEFVKNFMNADNIVLSSRGKPMGSYSLRGSFGAAVEMAACQQQADYRRSGQRGSDTQGKFNM